MKLILLVLALYAILASACYYPFNNAHFANETLLKQYLEETASNGALGWLTNVIGEHAPIRPWPANNARGSPHVTIYYGFPDEDQRTRLKGFVEKAWLTWAAKIRPSSKANGHRLKGVQEYQKGGQHALCDKDHKDGTKKWNPKVADHTLQIKVQDPGVRASTSIAGFSHENFWKDEGRHQLSVYETRDSDLTLVDVIHEMGHVFGLMHEHQRDDRDDYVYYDCTKLRGYDAYNKAVTEYRKTHPDSPTMYELCEMSQASRELWGWQEPFDWTVKLPTIFGL